MPGLWLGKFHVQPMASKLHTGPYALSMVEPAASIATSLFRCSTVEEI
jgi:hypothetical protein